MAGTLQPLVNNQRIVNADGTPTDYFIRWAQERQVDIGEGITAAQALAIIQQFTADHPLVAGSGIILTPSGDLNDDVHIGADVQAILDQISTTWGAVLFRGTADWQALAPGSAGDFLKTNGAGADPEWAAAGGGGGGGMIAEVIANGTSAAMTISGIPATYKSLRFEVVGIQAGAGFADMGIRLNNDASAIYSYQRVYGGVTGPGTDQQINHTLFDFLAAATTAGGAGVAVSLIGQITDYRNTTFYKQFAWQGRQSQNDPGDVGYALNGTGHWKSTAVVNRVDAIVDAGVWKTGSTFRLYGVS